ncbi:MAG: hypothetical protein BHW21_09645 [Eubacterium sp. 45_250]|nr:MAG: hypothetical protein BHW21_09645 [Eubacterium sp. 45_250]
MHGCKTIQAHTDPHPTKSEWDSANAKQAHTDVGVTKGERDDAKQGIVRFLEGLVRRCGARAWRAFTEIVGRAWRQDGGADELSVTGNFKESVEIVMKGTICF